jgi:hypothetical protein
MKKLPGSLLVILLLLFKHGESNPRVFNSAMLLLSKTDSTVKHETRLTPAIGYRQPPILESPIANDIFINSKYYLTASPEFGFSIDYLMAKNVNIGVAINYQTIPFTDLSIQRPFYNRSSPYSFTTSPEFGCNLDYSQSKKTSIGLSITYQAIYTRSLSPQQPYYPHSLQFNCLDVGIHKIFFFQDSKNNNLHFYAGAKASLSIWNEADNWSNGYTNQYEPIIIYFPNNLQLSFLVFGGIHYFILPDILLQTELGFGYSTPFYAQFGITILLNGKS